MPRIITPQSKGFDLDKLPKWRRDWLEVFGNQWKMAPDQREAMTPEERSALEAATNPFSR